MGASFKRAPDFQRRADLVEATLDCIAELGLAGATVRAVAARAGVSNGLIRFHFASKENLVVAAYRQTIERMTQPAIDALAAPASSPRVTLSRFVAACLSGPVADPRMLSIWATFISQIRVDAQIAQVHHDGYLSFRRASEPVIEAVLREAGRETAPQAVERLGIAINALIDGLWLEGCLAENYNAREQIDIGLRAVETLLGVKLPDPF